MIQIGDNDSGRLLKLDLKQDYLSNDFRERKNIDGIVKEPFVENELNNDSLPAVIFAITNLNSLKNYAQKSPVDFSIMNALIDQNSFISQSVYDFSSYNTNHNMVITNLQNEYKHEKKQPFFYPMKILCLIIQH